MKRLAAYTIMFFLLWGAWLFMCPNYLRILEGFDFFTTLPDFTELNLEIPRPGFMYISSFLLQFYRFPVLGALINAFIIMLQVLCIDTLVRKLFKESEGLWWIALIPTPFFTRILTQDLGLVTPLIWLTSLAAAAVAAGIIMLKIKPFIQLPRLMHKLWTGAAVGVVSVCISGFMIYNGLVRDGREEMAALDYMVEHRQWDRILEEVSVQDAKENGYMRKCALLALTQKGMLAEEAFRYGISGSDDFHYQAPEMSMYRLFNMRFYSSLGIHSPAVYYAYQLASQFYLGMCFDSARALADTYLEVKDYDLAEKYIEILSHTACHRKWVKQRRGQLEAIKECSPEYVAEPSKAVWGRLTHDMPVMMERCPDDFRYQDIYLCGILADRKGNMFYPLFSEMAKTRYADGERIPRVYQEALLVCLSTDPEELRKYDIDKEISDDFKDFGKLVSTGKENVARRKYSGTFWAYLFFHR